MACYFFNLVLILPRKPENHDKHTMYYNNVSLTTILTHNIHFQ